MIKNAQTICASDVFLQNQIRFLITINNEAKTRRLIKFDILKKEKKMIYKNFKQAKIKRKKKKKTSKKSKTAINVIENVKSLYL